MQPYFSPDIDRTYYDVSDPDLRRKQRDIIVLNRIRALDIEFNRFEAALSTNRNSVATGGDLVVLTLNGLGATTGGAALKTALAAASAGVVGAQGAIDRDLFYERTVPALIAELQANRTNIKATILSGLSRTDAAYPLPLAYLDLDALKNAGGIPSAISTITEHASLKRADAQAELDSLRSVPFSHTDTATTLRRWLYGPGPDGTAQIDPARRTRLTAWIRQNIGDVPFSTLLTAPQLEQQRRGAIAALVGGR